MMGQLTETLVRSGARLSLAVVVVSWCVLSASTVHADTEWAERIPPSPAFLWSFVPDEMPGICEHFRSTPQGNTFVGTDIPPGESSTTFLARVLSVRAPNVFNRGCKAASVPIETPDARLIDMQRRVVVMESAILQEDAIDAYGIGTLDVPDVPHPTGRAMRVSYPSSDPAGLESSFESICEADEAPLYCRYIARIQTRGSRVEVDLVLNRFSASKVEPDALDAAGWRVDVTSEPLSKLGTAAAEAFVSSEAGLAAYVSADGWLRGRLAEQVQEGGRLAEALHSDDTDETVAYFRRAMHRLGFVYERALMDASEREVHSQTLLATADDQALTVDAVQSLTAYGSRLMVEGRGPKPEPQRAPEAMLTGEFALDFGKIATLVRPARWLTEPFTHVPRDEHVSLLLSDVEERTRRYFLERAQDNAILSRLRRDRAGPPDVTWFTALFQPMSTIAASFAGERTDGMGSKLKGLRGLSVEFGIALYRDIPFDLEFVVHSDIGNGLVEVLMPFVRWSADAGPGTLDRAKVSVGSGTTRVTVGEPHDSDAEPLGAAELARVVMNIDRIKAQLEVMSSPRERGKQLSALVPHIASFLCSNPSPKPGCVLWQGRGGNGGDLYRAIDQRRDIAVSMTSDAKTRVFRLEYGRASVVPPTVPQSSVEPATPEARDRCLADAMWAAADLMSRDILGMHRIVSRLDLGRPRARLLMGGRSGPKPRRISVEDVEKAQAKYLEGRRDALVTELESIEKQCEDPDSDEAAQVRATRDFWKAWSPSHELVGYKRR